MPDAMRERAKVSARKVAKDYTAPAVEITPRGFQSPYHSADEADWWRLLGEAFGTRMSSVIEVFMRQVASLVGTHWDDEAQARVPNAEEINAALAIVAAMKPRNEAEAAQAAQAFAVHLVAMKVGGRLADQTWVDPRQANALANLVKAYSGVMDSMSKRRSSGATRQTIVVKKDVRIFNDNRRVDLGGRGGNAADQSHGAEGNTRARARADNVSEGATYAVEDGPALLRPPEDRRAVQGSCDEGAEVVPLSRGQVARSA